MVYSSGWGDRLAWFLAVTRLAKLAPGKCGCKKRQEQLNAVGRWVAKQRKRLAAIRR